MRSLPIELTGVLVLWVLGCQPSTGGAESDGSSGSSTIGGTGSGGGSSSGTTGGVGSSSSASPTTGDGWQEAHGPCIDGTCPDEAVCVMVDGGSVCGPACGEKGPGFARCPASEVQLQSICPWDVVEDETEPSACLITCTVSEDCPDPGMICVPCPEIPAGDCANLSVFGKGPDFCVWPSP